MWGCISQIWQYLKDHDAPNWVAIIFSLFIWPPILAGAVYWWVNRQRQSIPYFIVTFAPAQIDIGGTPYPSVLLTFINQTGSIVYLSHARLTEVESRFPIPVAASRDMARGWRELVFALQVGQVHDHYECILQTDLRGRVYASIATKKPMEEAFYSYRPAPWRRVLRLPKYFLLEYVVMVGDRKYSLATVY